MAVNYGLAPEFPDGSNPIKSQIRTAIQEALITAADTVSDVQTNDHSGTFYIQTGGLSSKGDGLGGIYWFDSIDTTSSDNGWGVLVDTAGNRFKLLDNGAYVVNTIDDIQTNSLEGNDDLTIYVAGFGSKSDGGEGFFYWDTSTDKNQHDGGIVIDPTHTQTAGDPGGTWWTAENSGAGVWRRVLDNYTINAQMFGATGTDDDSAIDATVRAALDNELHIQQELPSEGVHELASKMYKGDTVRIGCYGDSTTDGNSTTGWTANPTDGSGDALGSAGSAHEPPNAWPTFLEAWLQEFYDNTNIETYNAGYSGQEMRDGWAFRNYEDALENIPDYGEHEAVIVAFGINDTRYDADYIVEHIRETEKLIIKILLKNRMPILMANDSFYRYGGPTTDQHTHTESNREYNKAKKHIAEKYGIPFWDLDSAQKEWRANQSEFQGAPYTFPDLLHPNDRGHAFKAGWIFTKWARDIAYVDGTTVIRLHHTDSRLGFKWDEAANQDHERGTSRFDGHWFLSGANFSAQGETIMEAWVFCSGDGAELLYRGVSNHSIDQTVANADRPTIEVRAASLSGDWTAPEYYPSTEMPAVGVSRLNGLNKYDVDRPYRITRLIPGLNKVILQSPNSIDIFGGWFEINPFHRPTAQTNQLQMSDSFSFDYVQTNALKETGKIIFRQTNNSGNSGHMIAQTPEAVDGSNILSFGHDGDDVEVWMDVEFPSSNEATILLTGGFGINAGGDPFAGLALFVDSGGNPKIGYFEDSTFSTLASGTFNTPGVSQKLIFKFQRSGDVVTIDVWDDWDKSTSAIISYDSSTNSYQIAAMAGVCPYPGLYFPTTSVVTKKLEIKECYIFHSRAST